FPKACRALGIDRIEAEELITHQQMKQPPAVGLEGNGHSLALHALVQLADPAVERFGRIGQNQGLRLSLIGYEESNVMPVIAPVEGHQRVEFTKPWSCRCSCI